MSIPDTFRYLEKHAEHPFLVFPTDRTLALFMPLGVLPRWWVVLEEALTVLQGLVQGGQVTQFWSIKCGQESGKDYLSTWEENCIEQRLFSICPFPSRVEYFHVKTWGLELLKAYYHQDRRPSEFQKRQPRILTLLNWYPTLATISLAISCYVLLCNKETGLKIINQLWTKSIVKYNTKQIPRIMVRHLNVGIQSNSYKCF